MQKHENDVFLWLKRPVIDEMLAVLGWAHKHALREDIRCREREGGIDKYPSDRKFEDIVGHLNRKSKLFFRIIVRKGLNRFMAIDRKKYADLIDIGIHCVCIEEKEYFINCYLSSTLFGRMKRRFALTENVR